jgi:hypothetical protein
MKNLIFLILALALIDSVSLYASEETRIYPKKITIEVNEIGWGDISTSIEVGKEREIKEILFVINGKEYSLPSKWLPILGYPKLDKVYIAEEMGSLLLHFKTVIPDKKTHEAIEYEITIGFQNGNYENIFISKKNSDSSLETSIIEVFEKDK